MDINRSETITLAVVSDDHYMILLAALVKSIEKNLAPGVKIDLWIIEDNVCEDSIKRLHDSIDPAITSLHWRSIGDVLKSSHLPNDRSTYPQNIYARLFIPYCIPEAVEKVLYLDVDMIALTDLSALWLTNIDDYILAAVTDVRARTFDNHWGGILNYKELGLDGASKYFNTGVLLINTRKWRGNKITERVLATINKNIEYANYPDQYGLNIVAANNWLELPGRWNHFATLPDEDPGIIHFIDRKPIYKAYKNSSVYREHFYRYLNETAWKNTQPIGELRRRWKKLKNILGKITGFG